MDDAARLERRIEELEARVEALEKEKALHKTYPAGLTKSRAAELLSVTRATVYCMIRDGRLKVNAMGRVTGDSIEALAKAQDGYQGRYKRRAR